MNRVLPTVFRRFACNVPGHVPVNKLNPVLRGLRDFMNQNGFKESFPQVRRHIMPACEDETTIAVYNMTNLNYPLPQTGQMGLEDDVLGEQGVDKAYCLTASYRDEKNPKERHDRTFPLFEFESLGNFNDLLDTAENLLRFLGYTDKIHRVEYAEMAYRYGVDTLEHSHEEALSTDFGPAVFLCRFPPEESYWNMRINDGKAMKMDAILGGVETFGTAERECDKEIMRHQFHTISNGEYAKKLFDEFGEDRVMEDFERYIQHTFVPRYGGGIGVTRLIKFLEKQGLMEGLEKRYSSPN